MFLFVVLCSTVDCVKPLTTMTFFFLSLFALGFSRLLTSYSHCFRQPISFKIFLKAEIYEICTRNVYDVL